MYVCVCMSGAGVRGGLLVLVVMDTKTMLWELRAIDQQAPAGPALDLF